MFGIEITLEDPAAGARAELRELKQALAEVEESAVQRLMGAVKRIWQPDEAGALSNQAARVLALNPLFLDYETTGLNKRTDRVVEVSAIDAQGRVLFSTLVNPQRPIPAKISAINGITDRDVADAPTWRHIEPLLRELLAGRVVVAHNAPFEAKFTPFEVEWACSKAMADAALGKADWWEARQDWRVGGSLRARLYQCGLPAAQQHTAAGDCLDALRLVKYLAGDTSPVELKYQ